MRNILFLVALGAALLPVAVFAFPFAMNECQLSFPQSAVDDCFVRNERGMVIYGIAAITFLISAVWLNLRKSNWAFIALLVLAFGPLATLLITMPT